VTVKIDSEVGLGSGNLFASTLFKISLKTKHLFQKCLVLFFHAFLSDPLIRPQNLHPNQKWQWPTALISTQQSLSHSRNRKGGIHSVRQATFLAVVDEQLVCHYHSRSCHSMSFGQEVVFVRWAEED
jgi:hypothetical protein